MSKEELEKKGAVVVTGGSSGIGAATVRAFCDTHSVVFACDRNPVAQDAEFPPNVRFVQADISSESDVARLAGIVAEAGIPLDVIVNNAGITHIASIETIRVEDWRRVMDVNITGTFLVTRSLLPLLRSPGGVIVNVASDQSVIAKPNRVAYGTSKGAIAQFTKSLAVDLAGRGIRAVCVSPGPVDTPMLAAALASGSSKSTTPLGRVASACEVAVLIRFLAGADAAFITGANILIDGGLTAL